MKKLFFTLLTSFSILAFDAYSDCIEFPGYMDSGHTLIEHKLCDLREATASIDPASYEQLCKEEKSWCMPMPVDPNIKLDPFMSLLKASIEYPNAPYSQMYKKAFLPSGIEGIHFELMHKIRLIKVENGERKVILSTGRQEFLSDSTRFSYSMQLKGKIILRFYRAEGCLDKSCSDIVDYFEIYVVDINKTNDYSHFYVNENDILFIKDQKDLYMYSRQLCEKNKQIVKFDFETKKRVKISVPNCSEGEVFDGFFQKGTHLEKLSFQEPIGWVPLEKKDVPALKELYKEFLD